MARAVKRISSDAGRATLPAEVANQLLVQLPIPCFALAPSSEVILWNRACELITGTQAAEVLGTRDHWRPFYDFERPCLADLIVERRAGEVHGLYAGEVRHDPGRNTLHTENWCLMQRTGQRLYLGFDAGPIYDAHGNLVAVIEAFRDKTSHKLAQANLQELATLDPLTGLPNRGRLDQILTNEWLRAIVHESSIGLLMIDIDHFKRWNDSFGHQEGDRCLKTVADIIARHMFRDRDVAARYGGEEFVVILPGASAEGALAVADRIRDAVGRLPSADSAMGLTVSIGVTACAPKRGDDLTKCLTFADAALYRAKRDGRNRIAFLPYDSVKDCSLLWTNSHRDRGAA